MTKEEALREENALCDLEKKHSFSLGRTVTDRGRVAKFSKREESKKSPEGTSAGTLIIGSGVVGHVASGICFGPGFSTGAIMIGYNSFMPPVPNLNAGKTEERGLAG